MGVLDFIVRQIEAVGAVATAGQRAVQQLGEEAERKFLEITGIEQKERELKSKIEQTATALIEGLQSLAPRYEGKLQQMKDEVTEVAATAAGKGVDITKAVNAAVDIMLRKVEEALNSAFEAVNEFLEEAEKQLFEILQGLLPELLHGLLDPLRVKLREVVDVLKTLGKMIQDRILGIFRRYQSGCEGLRKEGRRDFGTYLAVRKNGLEGSIWHGTGAVQYGSTMVRGENEENRNAAVVSITQFSFLVTAKAPIVA
jgi:hypothetical protein